MKFTDRHGNTVDKPEEREILQRTSVYGLHAEQDYVFLFKELSLSYWELPGGGVESDLDESEVEALKREFLEETGFCYRCARRLAYL